MGDDTYGTQKYKLGQCGIEQEGRRESPPFMQKRIRQAVLVANLPKINKIAAGGFHSLALSENGELYGWGSNSKVQLSNEVEYSKVENPMMAIFRPTRFTHNIKNNEVTDMAAGYESTIIVTKNKSLIFLFLFIFSK